MSEGERSEASSMLDQGFYSGDPLKGCINSHYHQYKDQFSYNTTNSHIFSYGGPMYRVGNFSLTDWENGVLDHLVAIDRSGVPLYSVINTNNVPELPDSTLLTMCIKLSQSTTRLTPLLAVQTPQAPSLIFKPMWTMARAKRRIMAYFFGGMYQTCHCKNISSKIIIL